MALNAAYEMMRLEDYVGPDGQLDSNSPTWSQFRHYYYNHDMHKDPQKVIAREALLNTKETTVEPLLSLADCPMLGAKVIW